MKNLILLSLLIGLCSCQAPATESSTKEMPQSTVESKRAPLVHTVFFYLKDDVTDQQKAEFEKGLEKLGQCEHLANWRIGKPAATENRDVIDSSYDYAWINEFHSIEDHDAYQVDKLHTDMIDQFKDLWSSVKVYDSMMMD